MTLEEAIRELKILKEDYWDDDGYGHETKQYEDTMLALDMAIKALEQEPIIDKIRAEIKDWQVDIHDNEYDADKHDFVFERIFEIIDEYKAESEDKK